MQIRTFTDHCFPGRHLFAGVGVTLRWKFSETTWKVLLACIIPFGTFYIDRKILRKIRWAAGNAKA